MILKLSNTPTDVVLLAQYLCEVDKDFRIPLSSQSNLKDFAVKLLQYGHAFLAMDKDRTAGLIAFYCNNYQNHQAHLPILSVKQAYRGQGYARRLINIAICVCRLYQMDNILVDSVSPIAIALYKSIGFCTYKISNVMGIVKEYMSLNIPQIPSFKLNTFLQEINNEYSPHLDSKVHLSDYADKILNKASYLVECDNSGIIGLVVFYCNNTDNLKAYIPLVGILPRAEHQGIATRMVECVCQYIKEQKFKKIGIHSNNPVTVRMFQKLEFEVLDSSERKYLEKIL